MPDFAFFEVFEEEKIELKRYLPSNRRVFFSSKTIQSSGITRPPAPIISIRTQSIIPFSWEKSLRGILSRSSGFDHLAELAPRIPCGYLPEYCVAAVAEHAILLALALARRLPAQMKKVETFSRDGMTGQELRDKNLLVVGVGRIGGEVVRLGQALGMTVRGVDIVRKRQGLEYVSLARGLRWAQVVVACLPLTEKT